MAMTVEETQWMASEVLLQLSIVELMVVVVQEMIQEMGMVMGMMMVMGMVTMEYLTWNASAMLEMAMMCLVMNDQVALLRHQSHSLSKAFPFGILLSPHLKGAQDDLRFQIHTMPVMVMKTGMGGDRDRDIWMGMGMGMGMEMGWKAYVQRFASYPGFNNGHDIVCVGDSSDKSKIIIFFDQNHH